MIIENDKNPKISIVILNWNNWKDTIKCLESIYRTNYTQYQVVLVDNNSDDDSLNKIREFANSHALIFFELNETELKKLNLNQNFRQKHLTIIENNQNYGFAGGNNIGMKYSLQNLNSDYILLLNNDTIVEKNFLEELLKVAKANDNVGSVQSLLLRPEKDIVDSLGQRIFLWGAVDEGMGSLIPSNLNNIEIFGSCAACALYPIEVLRKTGLFDDDFFVGLEDVDLSWKIRLAGYKSFLASNSRVYHKRGVSRDLSIGQIVKGLADEITMINWYNMSKNWLIIVLSYYNLTNVGRAVVRYPHKVFFTLFRLLYSSIWLRKTQITWKIFSKHLKLRKEIKNNPLWDDVQQKWIKSTQKSDE